MVKSTRASMGGFSTTREIKMAIGMKNKIEANTPIARLNSEGVSCPVTDVIRNELFPVPECTA